VRSTTIGAAEERIVVDATDKIYTLKPAQYPLATLLTQVKGYNGSPLMKSPTTNYEFTSFESYPGGRYCKVSGTYAASGALANLYVTGAGSSSAYIFTVGDTFKNARTGEVMVVETVPAATYITVASTGRAFGTTAAAAGADGDGLFRIGNVNEENSTNRNVNTTRTTKVTNYTQIFKTTISISGSQKSMKMYGGPDLARLRADKGVEHALEIEESFWWGEKKAGTGAASLAMRATGGINEFIETGGSYVQDQGGILTSSDFDTFLREGFTYGNGGTKTLFAGSLVLQAINSFSAGKLVTAVGDTTYGVKISKFISAYGDVNIVRNPQFVEDRAGYGFLLDMDCFKYRYLVDRDTTLRTNIHAPGTDGEIDEYLTEAGLERNLSANCALLKGVQS
jgi:hypothetical protein